MEEKIKRLENEINLLKEKIEIYEKHTHTGFDSQLIDIKDIKKIKGEIKEITNSVTKVNEIVELTANDDFEVFVERFNEVLTYLKEEKQNNSLEGIEDVKKILLNNGFLTK